MLREAAISWVQNNCPDPKLKAAFVQQLDAALHERVNCWFVIGRQMTRQHVATIVHCFAGELFIFQLTDAQAASLGAPPTGVGFSRDPHPLSRSAAPHPLASLSNLELDRPTLTAQSKITGWCSYEILGEAPPSFCLQLDYSLGRLGKLIN